MAILRHEEEAVDLSFEVPVGCGVCRRLDCPGCDLASESASGVVTIIPWEARGSVWHRLWATTRATTYDAESFFAVLPSGDLSPPMRFAILAELLAVLSMAIGLLPLVVLALPTLLVDVVRNPSLRGWVARWVLLGIPMIAAWMVLAHVGHGAALDLGARRQGGRADPRRAVRYGLYACGWDLMFGPVGAVVESVSRGWSALIGLPELMVHVPGRATTAFLRGIYQLSPPHAARARWVGGLAVLVLIGLSGLLVVGVALALLLF